MIETLGTALLMGLLSSVHCALMCGPLAVAGCGRRSEAAGYFGGRALAYAFAGAIFGALGHSIALGPTWGLLLAALMIGYGLSMFRPRDPELVHLPKPKSGLRFFARLLPRRGLGLGIATGALPCGMLAGAWMLAASTRHPLHGALVMLAFSIASLPGLVAPLIARRIASRFARISPRVQGALWCLLGLYVAARPLLSSTEGCH